jgi:hypothetical protein
MYTLYLFSLEAVKVLVRIESENVEMVKYLKQVKMSR